MTSVKKCSFIAFGCILGFIFDFFIILDNNYSNEDNFNKKLITDEHKSRRPTRWQQSGHKSIGLEFRKNKDLQVLYSKLLKGEKAADWLQALDIILKNTKIDSERGYALNLLFLSWARHDLKSALENTPKSGLYTSSLRREIFNQLISEDPELAVVAFEENKELLSNNKGFLLANIVLKWAQNDPEQAWNWCFSFNGRDRDRLLTVFMEGIQRSNDFDQTSVYLNKLLVQHGEIPAMVISRLSENSPSEMIDWLRQFPPSSERDRTISIIQNEADSELGIKLFSSLNREQIKP